MRGAWYTCEPIGRDFALDPGELTDEQRKALEHVLVSRDLVMDVSGIAGAGKSLLLKQVERNAFSMGKGVAIFSPTDASVKDLRKAGFQARTFQGFQLKPQGADVLVIDEASMLSVPQMRWLVNHARKNDSRVLLVGDVRCFRLSPVDKHRGNLGALECEVVAELDLTSWKAAADFSGYNRLVTKANA